MSDAPDALPIAFTEIARIHRQARPHSRYHFQSWLALSVITPKTATPNKSLEELQRLLEMTQKTTDQLPKSSELHVRDISRRLGQDTIDQLVEGYKSGVDTTRLMATYQLSKSSVLKLLALRDVTMRRQPMTAEQIETVVSLYSHGRFLTALAGELKVPREPSDAHSSKRASHCGSGADQPLSKELKLGLET